MSQIASQPEHHDPGAVGAGHTPHVAHHFSDMAQQKESATLGMWLFLATEVMLFGAIFACYTVYRYQYYHEFVTASNHLWVSLGTINTVILLGSSFAMAMAVHSGHDGDSKKITLYLLLTILLGLTFVAIKFTEYVIDYKEGLIPVLKWEPRLADPHQDQHVKLFFVFYFIMTGLHALHMVAGMGVLAVIAWLAHRRKFTSQWYTPVEMAGLYWHFVDVVWVFLFPTLYLVNPALRFHH
jgi:cytochrome c oxidase subunit III